MDRPPPHRRPAPRARRPALRLERLEARATPAWVPTGPEFRANTFTSNTQAFPAVAVSAAGDFVVAWQSDLQDGDGYGQIAQAMREGRFEDPTRGPLYSLFIAVAGSPPAAKILQSALDAATVALVFSLARRRLWAAWLWAVYPFAIWRCGFINREILLTFLLAGYVWAQVTASKLSIQRKANWLSETLFGTSARISSTALSPVS